MPSPVVRSIPWRLLPSLNSLEVGFGHRRGSAPAPTIPRRALILTDLDLDNRADADAIAQHYPTSTVIDDPSITLTRLVAHCAAHDIVHLTAHGRIDPVRTRATSHDDGVPRQHRDRIGRKMAEVVVIGACDLDADERIRVPRLAWNLLNNGVRFVIFSTLELGEVEVRQVMPELHRMLATGIRPEAALRQPRFADPATQVAADSLLSLTFET